MNLTPADLEVFRRLGIDSDLLARAGVERVTDKQARDKYGISCSGDLTGIIFPYFSPMTGKQVTVQLRRDNPEVEAGKETRKYLSPYGDRKHLYLPPGAADKLKDASTPIILVEAEKSSLAVTAWADRNGENYLTVGLGGCNGWLGRIGKTENSRGQRVDEKGPLPELSFICANRDVVVMLDSNTASNSAVRSARAKLARTLSGYGARVRIGTVPKIDGVKINGPDDLIKYASDAAIYSVLELAKPVQQVVIADARAAIEAVHKAGSDRKAGEIELAMDAVSEVGDKIEREVLIGTLARAARVIGVSRKTITDGVAVGWGRHKQDHEEMQAEQARQLDEATMGPVDGAQLLTDLAQHFAEHVKIGPDEYIVLAMWVLHCHAWPAWTRTPYLHLSSATPECGKTLLLELVEMLVDNGIFVMGVSAAVLPRTIHDQHPVLLIDEVDQLIAGNKELWATILQTGNSGYKKSGTRLILEPAKDNSGWVSKKLSTFCPKIWAGISGLPPATASRCIPITMQRMMPNDRVKEIDEYITEPAAKALFKRCAAWSRTNLKALRDSRPDAPAELGHRQREVSRPLLAIADLAGDGWGEKLRSALVRLFRTTADAPDDNFKIQLLHDLEKVFKEKKKISSINVVSQLVEIADSRWASWGKQQKPINQSQLAGLLKDFKVYPRMQRNDDDTNLRGYDRDQFEPLWRRYPNLEKEAVTNGQAESENNISAISPDFTRNSATTPVNTGENEFSRCNKETNVAPSKSAPNPHKQRVVAGAAPKKGVNGGVGQNEVEIAGELFEDRVL